MLSRNAVEEFNAQGFLKGDVILSEAEVDHLNQALDQVLAGQTEQKPVLNRNLLHPASDDQMAMRSSDDETVIQIVNIWMASPAFLDHARNSRICEEVAQLAGTDTLRIWHDQIQYKPPVIGGPTYWHQDHPAWPVLQPADLISAWVALDDATIDNGSMWMVPGSHRWGNVSPYLKTDEAAYTPYLSDPSVVPENVDLTPVPFEIRRGQVGYHHCLMWHGALPNRSQKKRRAIAVHYMPGHIRYVPQGGHVMDPFIQVEPGSILAGDGFPIVFQQIQHRA